MQSLPSERNSKILIWSRHGRRALPRTARKARRMRCERCSRQTYLVLQTRELRPHLEALLPGAGRGAGPAPSRPLPSLRTVLHCASQRHRRSKRSVKYVHAFFVTCSSLWRRRPLSNTQMCPQTARVVVCVTKTCSW